MRSVLTAIALAMVAPSVAYAQAAPNPPAKEACCEKMKAEGMKCDCKMMDKMSHGQKDMKGGAESNAEHKH